MGSCSSPALRARRPREAKLRTSARRERTKNESRNADSTEKGTQEPTTTQGSKQPQAEGGGSPCLGFLGEIWGQSKVLRCEGKEEALGVGCMVSERILLASDHYLHLYNPQELSLRPLGGGRAVRVAQCLYPPAASIPKDKKRSMFLHRRIGVALYLLDSSWPGQAVELGTSVVEEWDDDSLQCLQLRERMIEESSRTVFLLTTPNTPERGWPLLYQLYGRYYCVGLYSFPHTSDSLLLTEHIAHRFKITEEKYCHTQEITSVEISEAVVEMEVEARGGDRLQDLIEELREAEAIGDPEEIAESHFKLGVEYGLLGNFQQQKKSYENALSLYLCCSYEPTDSIASLHHNLGICECELGDPEAARTHLLKSLELKQGIGEQGQGEAVADTYNELGVVSRKQGRAECALEYYYKAYHIYSQIEYHEKMGIVLNNIALLTHDDQTHTANQAKFKHILAILAKTKGQNSIEVAEVLFNLAQMESEARNFGLSITYLSKAANILKNLQLEDHSHYRRIAAQAQAVEAKVQEHAQRKEWALKSKALLQML